MSSRTYEWLAPESGQDFLTRMNGLEYCRALINGTYPVAPIVLTIGLKFQSVEPGIAVASLEPHPFLMHGRGFVHGGAISTLLDTVMAWAVLSILERGRGFTTSHLGVDFVRPVSEASGSIVAHARVLNAGRHLAVCEAKAVNRDGKLIASGNSTCLLTDKAS